MLTDCGGFWHFIKIYIKGKCSNTKCEKNWHVKRGFKVLNKIKVTFVRILCVCHQFDMIRGSFCLFCYIWVRIMQKKKLRALATSKLSWVGLSLLSVCPKNSLRSSQLIQVPPYLGTQIAPRHPSSLFCSQTASLAEPRLFRDTFQDWGLYQVFCFFFFTK